MKICWDTLENLRYLKSRDVWVKGGNKYVIFEKCPTCGESFIGRKRNRTMYCSYKCSSKANLGDGTLRHGDTGTKLHSVWLCMKDRCKNKNNIKYHRYGGRGIRVCEEWDNSYESFRDFAINNGWNETLTIDRIDNNGAYEPDNVRFVTNAKNQNNKSDTVKLKIFGEIKSIAEWGRDKRCAVGGETFRSRIKLGWNPYMAISQPKMKRGDKMYTIMGKC